MRSEAQFLAEYAVSHQNPTNQVVHMICVPVIFIASIALLWLLPVGRFLPGVPADIAPYLNGATIGLIPALVMYARMSVHALLIGSLWLALSFALTLAGLKGELPVGWIAASAWIAAWVAQFWGHHVEGAKPSFADDLLFLLVGPLFVQQKFSRLFGGGAPTHKA